MPENQSGALRIAIVGSGAIGGLVGAKLALSGQDVTFIDQGDRLDAIRRKGLELRMADGSTFFLPTPPATGDLAEVGQQDLVILGVKAHHIPTVAEGLPSLFHADSVLVTLQNGIPWWYFQKHGGPFEGNRLQSLDPTGVIEASVHPDRIVGCVAYPAATVPAPGIIQHVEGDRFPIGELDGSESSRCQLLLETLTNAGFRSRIIDDIRAEMWLKAWGTLSFNPISALTHATMEEVCWCQDTRNLAAGMMLEAQEIAGKLGIQFRHTIERRLQGAEGVGPHKTSMLQDVEAGLELELDALMGAILELGELTGTPAPSIKAVHALVTLLSKTYLKAEAGVGLSPLTP